MSSNVELNDFTREKLYSIVNQLKRENECLKTDLIRFKLLSNSYHKLFDKIGEQIVFNNDFLDLKNNIKVLNNFNKSEYFPKIVCIKLNENDLQSINGLNTKSQTNVDKPNEELIQTEFNENNLSDNEISDNHSEGIYCDNNDTIESNDETIDGSVDENKNQLSIDCSENLIKSQTNENSMEISFETIVKNEIQTEDNSTKVLNLSQIEISNIRSLRNRNSIQTNYNTISGESEVIGIDLNDNSDNDVDYDSNEEQMSDNSDDIWNEYNLIVDKNVRKIIKDSDNIYRCDVENCSAIFRQKHSLLRHQNRHSGKYKCEVDGCLFRGGHSTDLANHKERMHRTNDYYKIYTRKDLNNSSRDVFTCDYKNCSAVFKNSCSLIRHKNVHLAKFKCNVKGCDYRAGCINHMNTHMKTRHSNVKPFECSVEDCDQSFKTKGNLNRHKQIDHKLFVCNKIKCNLQFNSINDLDNHMITHLPISVTTNRESDIEVNQKNTDIIENNSSEENTEFICDWIGCDMKFNSRFRLFTHKLKHTSKTVEKSFTCEWEDCSKVFVNKKRFSEHIAVHKGTHTCDWDGCQYKAPSNANLILHKISHSEDRPFICEINDCKKLFKTEKNLKNHQLSQHPNQLEHISWIKCTESGCDFTTKSNNSFLKHKTLHTLPFRCTHCPKGFRRNKSLVSHMAIHTGSTEHKWKCEWYGCDKMFNSRFVMLDHMNVHTAAKSYPCEWPGCDKTFILKRTLRQHIYRHKGLSYYNCKLCEYHTTNTIRYKNHMKKHQNSES